MSEPKRLRQRERGGRGRGRERFILYHQLICTAACAASLLARTGGGTPQDGETPLHTAVMNGKSDVVTALIDAKAAVEAKKKVCSAHKHGNYTLSESSGS